MVIETYNIQDNMNHFSIVMIGSKQYLRIPGIQTIHFTFEENHDRRVLDEADMIFLCHHTEWRDDGTWDTSVIEDCVNRIRTMTRNPMICLTSILPIGTSDRLGCHFLPILRSHPLFFGCNVSVPFDARLIDSFMRVIDRSESPKIYTTRDAETRHLIETCQTWINQSFQREMSIFCARHNVKTPFLIERTMYKKEMSLILRYMIRMIEDTRLDCPVLYSCLFRNNYIDHHVHI